MKFTVSLLALGSLGLVGAAAATPLSCNAIADVAACSPIQRLFGACAQSPATEVLCKTDRKAVASPVGTSKTIADYYSPPDGYALEPETARAVFDGRGTHGVDASLSRNQLYCLWGSAGAHAYADGYCEVRARLARSPG
jgi:hypothetical protein